jgi:hypothetical protein
MLASWPWASYDYSWQRVESRNEASSQIHHNYVNHQSIVMLASWPEASCDSPRQLALPKFIITTPITLAERVYLPLLSNGPIHIGANCSMFSPWSPNVPRHDIVGLVWYRQAVSPLGIQMLWVKKLSSRAVFLGQISSLCNNKRSGGFEPCKGVFLGKNCTKSPHLER